MELVRENKGFGVSVKSGKSLVAEIYKTGKIIVFEKAYGEALGKLAKTHTLTNSHSGKINWVAKLDEKQTEAFIKTLAKMDFVHTPGVKKAKTEPKAKQVTKAKASKAKANAQTKR